MRPEPGPTDRLVFLHGFTQTHHHWHAGAHAIASRLSSPPALAFVDLPGHGLARADRTPIADAGTPLAELAGRGTYVGYSMGGRFALGAAVARPDLVERLVLIGATPGIDDDDERTERRSLDEARAADLEAIGLEAFVDAWMAAPMFAGLPRDPADVEHRRRNDVAGLASSLRSGGTGSQPSLWARLHGLHTPMLVLAGANDAKFCDIGRAMVDAAPRATFRTIAESGHAAHTERPELTADVVAGWLVSTATAQSP